MLILRRKVGDSLIIGDNITLTVLSIDASGNINLGIDAPKDVIILRKELEQAKAANAESVASAKELALKALNEALPNFVQKQDETCAVKPVAPSAKPNKPQQ